MHLVGAFQAQAGDILWKASVRGRWACAEWGRLAEQKGVEDGSERGEVEEEEEGSGGVGGEGSKKRGGVGVHFCVGGRREEDGGMEGGGGGWWEEKEEGKWEGREGNSGAELRTASPALALVCVPLTITCSTRAEVSACHVVERTKAESNWLPSTADGTTPGLVWRPDFRQAQLNQAAQLSPRNQLRRRSTGETRQDALVVRQLRVRPPRRCAPAPR